MKTRIAFISLIAATALICSCASTGADDIQKATAHYQLGVSYMNQNNIEPAFVEFQKAIELNPDDKEAHNALGVLYLQKLDDPAKAISQFKEALRTDPNFPEAANNLGSAYARTGRYNEAIEFYKVALANPLYKNTVIALNNLGMVYYRTAKYDDAILSYKEALKRFSDSSFPYYGLALCYNAKGQYGDASVAMNRAIELDPLYKGDKGKAVEDLGNRKMRAKGEEEKDINDYLEILKY